MIRELVNSINIAIDKERKKLEINKEDRLIVNLDMYSPSSGFKGLKTFEATLYVQCQEGCLELFKVSITDTDNKRHDNSSWNKLLVPFMCKISELYLNGDMYKIIMDSYGVK